MIALAWGCNAILGLDDAERPLRDDNEGGSTDGGADASLSQGGRCISDDDCTDLDPCLSKRCERSTGRCLYATCQPKACERATCSAGSSRSCTQTSELYNAVAGDLGLPGVALGCGGDAPACFAAIYPFAFVGTTTGVVAVPVADLKQLEPPRIPVDLPFAPEQIVASGGVVYFRGPIANGKIALAALRVPSDPRVTRLTPLVAESAYPFPTGRLLPSKPDEALLVFDDASKGFPSATLDPTLRGARPFVHVPPPVEAGAPTIDVGSAAGMYGAFGPAFGDPDAGTPELVATASLDRLLLVQRSTSPRHAVVTGAGSPSANLGPAQGLVRFPTLDYVGSVDYAAAPDGTVVSIGAVRQGYDATRYRVLIFGLWLLDPGRTRLEGNDATNLQEALYDYDGGPPPASVPPPMPPRAVPIDGENVFFVSTPKTTNPSGLTVSATHRVTNNSVPFYPGQLVVFDDPTADMAPGSVGAAKSADLVLVLRKTASGAKLLAIDTRCAPK